ncbi:SDR family NAD(P)-dependent oxidoreductase [Pedobacter sp. HMF7647]|uniref:SDR family NAD(P)-dependent oxidoreductase n=1 Tax=Hufsiella arboris TaxID=2695275 RepID=A0A7K1YF14_9SPHI|nr:SDR family oxidoreductase [Hufsiella arboris]MXV53172.1 SDR family NAD(P)-dependent oxidoreductase [Hufsiella arboris]
MENEQKYALITGATSGIGYELAKLFAQDHYNLVIVARDEAELSKTASELENQFGITVTTFQKDLFNKEAAFEIYDETQAKGLNIDVLVNNAGQGQFGEFVDTDINRELDIIHLNICSTVILTKSFAQDMVARGDGKILNVASIAGKVPGPFQAVYHGTKAFVHSFNEAVNNELKGTGVTLTSLLPGATDTDFFNKAEMLDSKIVQEGKLGDPAQVAKDGYDALMAGEDKVISGMKNKMQVAMSNVTPDSAVAEMMHKQQEPVENKD